MALMIYVLWNTEDIDGLRHHMLESNGESGVRENGNHMFQGKLGESTKTIPKNDRPVIAPFAVSSLSLFLFKSSLPRTRRAASAANAGRGKG